MDRLVLKGFRYYDPGTGRFLTKDPIGYAGGINLYAYSGGSCFVAGTPVVMADGTTKPIEEVKEGDLVLSRSEKDDESGAIVTNRVVKTMVHAAPATLVLALSSGEVVGTTGEHPFYVPGKGFVQAKDLGIGTSLVTRAGPKATVVRIERRERAATVYNVTVEDTHTYFVGTNGGGVWVHNKPDIGAPKPSPEYHPRVLDGAPDDPYHHVPSFWDDEVMQPGNLSETRADGSRMYEMPIELDTGSGPKNGMLEIGVGPRPGNQPDVIFHHHFRPFR